MKILHEIREINRYLFGKMSPASRLVFEARLLIDPGLQFRVKCQERIYAVIRQSGRRKLKSEAARIHYQLFNDPAKREFQVNVFDLFQKK